ncbi:unnamed protein product, partial [Musa banksii]
RRRCPHIGRRLLQGLRGQGEASWRRSFVASGTAAPHISTPSSPATEVTTRRTRT